MFQALPCNPQLPTASALVGWEYSRWGWQRSLWQREKGRPDRRRGSGVSGLVVAPCPSPTNPPSPLSLCSYEAGILENPKVICFLLRVATFGGGLLNAPAVCCLCRLI